MWYMNTCSKLGSLHSGNKPCAVSLLCFWILPQYSFQILTFEYIKQGEKTLLNWNHKLRQLFFFNSIELIINNSLQRREREVITTACLLARMGLCVPDSSALHAVPHVYGTDCNLCQLTWMNEERLRFWILLDKSQGYQRA